MACSDKALCEDFSTHAISLISAKCKLQPTSPLKDDFGQIIRCNRLYVFFLS